ncbi:MAG: hypothetical protein RJA70_4930, partial [Pseudomonadota bacterium]
SKNCSGWQALIPQELSAEAEETNL